MILTNEQLNDLGKDKEPDKWIELARKESTLLKMNFYGTGLVEYLKQIQGLESSAQINLRKKYAISNQWLVETLLRPVDNAWNAKGGVTNIEAPVSAKEDLFEQLEDVNQGYSLDKYLQNIWFDRFITDPNGLLFNEVDENGETELVYKSIFDIAHMKVSGVQPEYIVFEPDVIVEGDKDKIVKTGEEKHELFWIVDDAFYYRVKRTNDGTQVIDQIVNTFGIVPATQNSPIVDTEKRIKVSPIHKQLELMDSYLIDNSINNIYKKLHGYPVFWMYAGKCESCKGNKEGKNGATCDSCGGSGQETKKKDVSDGLILNTPTDSDAPTIAPDVAGYVSPDLETWREQRTELEHVYNLIYFSQWGTTVERNDNETATGRFIDAQPVMNRLNVYSDVIELVKSRSIEMFARFLYPNTDIKVHVSAGRRYLVETPDQIWEKYTNTLEKGADESTKDLQLSQYYESEFKSDEFMKDYHLKLMKIEPLVHYNIPDVLEMELPQSVKDMKVAFPSWKNATPMAEVIQNEVKKSIDNLKQFTNDTIKGEAEPKQGVEV